MLSIVSVGDAVTPLNKVTSLEAHVHTFLSALKYGQSYKPMSKAREQDDSDRDGAESIATENGEGRTKAAFKV